MDNPRLTIRVCDRSSNEPLPQRYLELPDVAVSTASESLSCPRCGYGYRDHDWVVTAGSSNEVIDCSLRRRRVDA